MTDDYIPTVRIRRPARVTTDDRGRSVWDDTIETAQLELVSTTRLQTILKSGDADSRGAIRKVLDKKQEGVLARDTATGLYEVISDEDLQAILESDDAAPPVTRPRADVTLEPAGPAKGPDIEELSLVSTQMLRKIILTDDEPREEKPAARKPVAKKDGGGGFDPYNSG